MKSSRSMATSSRNILPRDPKKVQQLLRKWKIIAFSKGFSEDTSNYLAEKIYEECVKWSGDDKASYPTISELETETEAFQSPKFLSFFPINDNGDLRAILVLKNPSSKPHAFNLLSSDFRRYAFSQRAGQIAPNDSIVVEIDANITNFSDEDYIWVEVMEEEDAGVTSTIEDIIKQFEAAGQGTIETHRLGIFIGAVSPPPVGINCDFVLNKTLRAEELLTNRSEDAQEMAEIKENFKVRVSISWWICGVVNLLTIGFAYGAGACYKLYNP